MEIQGLIAGLGNPGNKYLNTRHNSGFMFVNALLADSQKISRLENIGAQKFNCSLWRFYLADNMHPWLCACPLTYMNESGKSIQALLSWFKLDSSRLLVVHDELDLPCGDLRFKFGGGNAGHNGLRSIDQYIGNSDYYRLRIGIGKPEHKNAMLDWVLGKPSGVEQRLLNISINMAVNVFYEYCVSGFQHAAALARSAGKKARRIIEEEI